MTFVVTERCIGTKDQSCMDVCPVDCIYDVGQMVVIHPDECIECGACEPACPAEAIVADDALAGEDVGLAEVNAAIVEGVPAVNAALQQLLGTPALQRDSDKVGTRGA